MEYYDIKSSHACSVLPIGFYRPPNEYQFLNYNERPNGVEITTIVLHYTVANFERSYYLLAHADGVRPGPSVHI